MVKLVTIFGGSGFLGRYVAQRMARAGWRVRVAVRRPNEALFVRTYGVVGQVEPVQANVRHEASVRAAVQGASAVVNCVGIANQLGAQRYDAVHVEGAGRVARAAREAGAETLVHISAIGADAMSDSGYARSKAEGEAAVVDAFADASILRPSVVFGPEDQFFNKLGALAMMSPVVPVVAPDTRLQPVFVEDVARAVEKLATGAAAAGLYELGGPDIETMRQITERVVRTIHRKRVLINVPRWLAALEAGVLDFAQFATMGLFKNTLLTRDQLRMLSRDNVVSEGARGLTDLGIVPKTMDAELETYLYVYRPGGQYDAIRESARRFRRA